jgi:hypothetical protein
MKPFKPILSSKILLFEDTTRRSRGKFCLVLVEQPGRSNLAVANRCRKSMRQAVAAREESVPAMWRIL